MSYSPKYDGIRVLTFDSFNYLLIGLVTAEAGAIFTFIRNRFVGSNFSFSAVRRASFAP
jgi:hypothetical protein